MIINEHKKHSDITRPGYGYYGRNEWAIVGSQCSTIRLLADAVIKALSPQYKCAYADAKHIHENQEPSFPLTLENGAITEYTNHLQYHQFNHKKTFNHFQFRQAFNDADMILVNGNHFEARSQVLVIDESKRASLKKRVSQLTNVELILLAGDDTQIFDFIKEALPSCDQLPVYKLNDTARIIKFFEKKMEVAKPPLNGLVLAGGKSVRMGYDKAMITWHGKEQQYYLADLMNSICNEVYISCSAGNLKQVDGAYQALPDTFTGLGPYGAILSAFREKPDAAWLVVACDLPLLDIETLQYLERHRNPSSMATAFESPFNGLPEPLITIWEPKSYPVLLSFLSQGNNCPVKALRNNDTTILKSKNPDALTNVNTREEAERVKELLKTRPPVNHAT